MRAERLMMGFVAAPDCAEFIIGPAEGRTRWLIRARGEGPIPKLAQARPARYLFALRKPGTPMPNLNLSVAVGDYDRNRPLIAGAVRIDGVDPVFMTLSPEEIFFRAFRSIDFDICELSLSSYTLKTALGECPYVAIPALLSKAFRHTSIYVRTDRIKAPADLKGRKVGVPEYQLTANVWARAILEDDFGVKPADIHWIRAGIEEPGRPEKIAVQLPAAVRLHNPPPHPPISPLLDQR